MRALRRGDGVQGIGSRELLLSVLSRKFIEEIGRENAGPSTPFGAKNAPNYAQDDSVFV